MSKQQVYVKPQSKSYTLFCQPLMEGTTTGTGDPQKHDYQYKDGVEGAGTQLSKKKNIWDSMGDE